MQEDMVSIEFTPFLLMERPDVLHLPTKHYIWPRPWNYTHQQSTINPSKPIQILSGTQIQQITEFQSVRIYPIIYWHEDQYQPAFPNSSRTSEYWGTKSNLDPLSSSPTSLCCRSTSYSPAQQGAHHQKLPPALKFRSHSNVKWVANPKMEQNWFSSTHGSVLFSDCHPIGGDHSVQSSHCLLETCNH